MVEGTTAAAGAKTSGYCGLKASKESGCGLTIPARVLGLRCKLFWRQRLRWSSRLEPPRKLREGYQHQPNLSGPNDAQGVWRFGCGYGAVYGANMEYGIGVHFKKAQKPGKSRRPTSGISPIRFITNKGFNLLAGRFCVNYDAHQQFLLDSGINPPYNPFNHQ